MLSQIKKVSEVIEEFKIDKDKFKTYLINYSFNEFEFITYNITNGKKVCFYKAKKISQLNSNTNFLNIPKENNKSIFLTDVITSPFYTRKGIAKRNFKNVLNELRERKVIHATGFTEEGIRVIWPWYMKENYKQADIIKSKIPEEYKNLSAWIYKNYS